MAKRTKTIAEAIAALPPEPLPTFIPTRYPYTYACDFLRQHVEIVPREVRDSNELAGVRDWHLMSRAEASGVRRVWARMTGDDDLSAAVMLADAAMEYDRVVVPEGVREEILANLTRPA